MGSGDIIGLLFSKFQLSNFNPFQANAPFLQPLKTLEKLLYQMFSGSMKRDHWDKMV